MESQLYNAIYSRRNKKTTLHLTHEQAEHYYKVARDEGIAKIGRATVHGWKQMNFTGFMVINNVKLLEDLVTEEVSL